MPEKGYICLYFGYKLNMEGVYYLRHLCSTLMISYATNRLL